MDTLLRWGRMGDEVEEKYGIKPYVEPSDTASVAVNVQVTPDKKELLLEAILDILKEIRDLMRRGEE